MTNESMKEEAINESENVYVPYINQHIKDEDVSRDLSPAYTTMNIKQEQTDYYDISVKQEFQEFTNNQLPHIKEEVNLIKSEDLSPATAECSVTNISYENYQLPTMEPGFQEATSSTLPLVTMDMIHDFYIDHYLLARGTKSARKKRENYGDNAIDYVQLSRQNDTVTLKCKVTPENGASRNFYTATITINETEQEILLCECLSCTTIDGGCKHAVAFLYWLHRRTEEPSSEKQKCYWKKPKLNNENEHCIMLKVEHPKPEPNSNLIIQPIKKCFKLLKSIEPTADLRKLMVQLKNIAEFDITPEIFINFCQNHITTDLCDNIFRSTTNQSGSNLWHELRYGRITASMFDDACDGYFGELVYGTSNCFTSKAMERGKRLKQEVLNEVGELENIDISVAGLQLLPENPIFGATPDGITDEYCIQIKCPSKKSTVRDYISRNKVQEKFLSQIMLQMYLCKKPRGLFCVASPKFEYTRDVEIVEVEYDENYLFPKLERAADYWKKKVFPKLLQCV